MRAKVWNDNTKEHVEEFRGEMVRIPAKGFIEMPWTSAVQFRGQYTPVIRDGLGKDMHPKMIRIERIPETVKAAEPTKFICQKDGTEFDTQAALDAYIAENHTDSMVDEEAQKKFKGKKLVG